MECPQLWYPVVNRRGKRLEWWAFNPDNAFFQSDSGGGWHTFGQRNPGFFSGYFVAPADHRIIDNNRSTDLGLKHSRMYFFIQGAVIAGPWTIQQGEHIVITPGDKQQAVISLEEAVRGTWARIHGRPSAPPKLPPNDDTMAKVLGIGLGVLGAVASAVATGISVSTAGFGAEKSYVALVGAILGQAKSWVGQDGDEGPPPPPDLDQIKMALAEVVQEANGVRAANLFAENYDYFSNLAEQIANVRGGIPQQQLVDRLDRLVENALDPTQSDSFVSWLSYVRDNPSVCKWLLPEYITAVGLYLVLCRLQFAKTFIPDSGKKPGPGTIPSGAIQSILDDVDQLRRGLINAASEFGTARSQLVTSSGLAGTPEAILIIKVASRKYLGNEYALPDDGYNKAFPNGSEWLPDFKVSVPGSSEMLSIPRAGQGYKAATEPDPIKSAIDHLDKTSKALAQDVQTVKHGGWPENLLKIDWTPAG